MPREKPAHQPVIDEPVVDTADVVRTDNENDLYAAGASNRSLTLTEEGRLRVSSDEKLQGTLEAILEELQTITELLKLALS